MNHPFIPVQPNCERAGSCRRHHPGGGPGWFGPGGGPQHGPGPFAMPFGGGRRGGRAARGQLRAAVLLLLAERPRHGYELITELTDRSEGRWNPSPGAVYPMLHRLAEKGLVTVEVVEGRKTFALTPAGTEFVEANRESWGEPWAAPESPEKSPERMVAEAGQVMAAASQVAMVGTEEQQQRAEEILTRARKDLFGLLAE